MNSRLKKIFAATLTLSLGLIAPLAGTVDAAAKVESKVLNVKPIRAEIDFIPNVVYAQVPTFDSPNTLLQMDILQPQVKRPMPAVVFVTGGGFIAANRARLPQLRMKLAESGYVVASITYRVAPNGRFPQPLEDVKSAIRFVKANAQKFNIDASRIVVVGDSAGGYLSAFAAATNGSKQFNVGDNLNQSSEILAAVDLYGLSDLSQVGADYSKENQKMHHSAGASEALWINGATTFGGVDGGVLAHPEATAAANPINYISKDSAPLLLMHGTADRLVSPSQTDLMFQAYRAAGVESDRYVIPGADHADEYWVQDNVLDLIVDWLDRHAKR